jgi:hypothetical protein
VIVWALSGDGCCPVNANANQDLDCASMCGNRIVEPGERCDGRCPSAEDCDDGNPCTRDALVGMGCDRHCTHVTIDRPAGNDKCCPAGGNANSDNDCSPVCGNRVVERGETCDGDCVQASSCNDNDACTTDVVIGSDCQRVCGHLAINPSGSSKDGCCADPRMTSEYMDADCPAHCGNGRMETNEVCDGNCPACVDSDTDPCTVMSTRGSACDPMCMRETITRAIDNDRCCPGGASSSTDNDCAAPAPVCGNNKKETGERCDGADCPSCDDGKACTTDRSVPTPDACHPVCENTPKVPNSTMKDGCCPSGEDSRTDKDCEPPEPVCGNDIKEAGETCDPCRTDCDDGQACTRDELTGPACNTTCTHEPIPDCVPE